MAKQNNKNQQATTNKIVNVKTIKEKSNEVVSSLSLFDILENHFDKNRLIYIIIACLLAGLFSILCFDAKISTSNDDALYIEAASNYAKDFFGYFYTTTAPLYPIILSFVVKIFGVKILILKLFSIIFYVAGICIFYLTFKNRIPYLILIPTLILTSINYLFLVHASLTYTETFFFFIQGICFYLIFKIFDRTIDTESTESSKIYLWIILGFIIFIQMITRNVALGFIGIVIVYLIYRKKYVATTVITISFIVYYFIYNKIILKYIWHLGGSQFSSQGNVMFQKDAYNPQMGKETFFGFIERFWGNCQIYLSSRFWEILGFRAENSTTDTALTIFTIAIFFGALYYMFKKGQQVLLFTTLYFIGLLGLTFISLHTFWAQGRLIMVYLPLMLFALFYLLYAIGKQISMAQLILPFVFVILLFTSIKTTTENAKIKFPVFIENMNGDATFGYTTDWQNYIKMSKWCGENLPNETKSIAVRKAPMSFIFSEGKEFYPIYNTPYQDADSLLTPFRTAKVNYIMPAKLRVVQDQYIEGQFISTVHRYMAFIAQKYGDRAFTYVHHEGEQEEAVLYKINWNYIDSLKATIK